MSEHLHVKYLLLSNFNEIGLSGKILEKKKKSSNVKFHQNLSSGSRVVPCGHDEAIVAFPNFANAPKN
jgi:hypothetical protein